MKEISQIRIATRQSQLALRQSELVKIALLRHFPRLNVSLVPIITSGDKLLDHPLSSAGGKGMFIKELEIALLENRADIAVHSLKDMTVQCTEGLKLTAFLERHDPRDAFISNHFDSLKNLPHGAKLGTASLRRTAMLKHIRPDLVIDLLRGNVPSRIAKLDNGDFDAIILAAAGLHRLGLDHRIKYYFSPEESLPAIGQGVICVECRSNDKAIRKIAVLLDHEPTRHCALAERAMNKALGGSCHAPIGGYATVVAETLYLRGTVASLNGEVILKAEHTGNAKEAEKIGEIVAKELLTKGAAKLLNLN